MARPLKEIKQKEFEALCAIQCTQEEICSVLDCDEVTLNSWCKRTYKKGFSQVFKEKRQGGRASLRRKQWNLADNNAKMAIWLGKQYLGQRDKQEDEIKDEMTAMLQNIQTMNEIFMVPAANRSIEDLES